MYRKSNSINQLPFFNPETVNTKVYFWHMKKPHCETQCSAISTKDELYTKANEIGNTNIQKLK